MERWLRDGPECDDAGWGEPNVAAPGGKVAQRSTRGRPDVEQISLWQQNPQMSG